MNGSKLSALSAAAAGLTAAVAFLSVSCSLDARPPGWTEPVLFYDRAAYFPGEVTEYIQAPGQFARNESFQIAGNTDKLLGPPSGGGTYAADNSSVVSLGMAGGSVTVKFDPPIADHSENIGGYDFIVFGNAYWPSGSPENVWQEPGTVWVMKDENGNGEPDDTWYLIPGSHLNTGSVSGPAEYSLNDTGLPPPADKKEQWWPEDAASPLVFPDVFLLGDEAYPVSGPAEPCLGYADAAPTLLLGDLSGAGAGGNDNSLDDPEDYPGIDPVYFYTVPDSHETPGIDAGSGGGNAIRIEWAVDPADFSPAGLDEISWIKIVSGSLSTGSLGDYSCEVDGFARVRRSAP